MNNERDLFVGFIKLMTSYKSLESFTMTSNIEKLMITMMQEIEKQESLDKDLIETITDLGGITVEYFNSQRNLIYDDCIIIYFPTAEMVKLYRLDQIDDFIVHIKNLFYQKEFYEIVRNNVKQKIVILYENTELVELDKLTDYIVNFLDRVMNYKISPDDIIVTINEFESYAEFVLSTCFVRNMKEKELFFRQLTDFITLQEGTSKIKRHIILDRQSNFVNTNQYKSINNLIQMSPRIRVQHIKNVIISNTNNCHGLCFLNDFDQYIENIKLNKPIWYQPNEWVHRCVLYDNFVNKYRRISPKIFTEQMKGRIFNFKNYKKINGSNKMAYLLLDWNEIN